MDTPKHKMQIYRTAQFVAHFILIIELTFKINKFSNFRSQTKGQVHMHTAHSMNFLRHNTVTRF